jgi:cytochrome c5
MMGHWMMGHANRGSAPSSSASGAQEFEHVCAKCHALPSPKLHTAAQWPPVVERMRRHLATDGIALDRKTELEIEHYLEKRATK